MDTAFDRDGFRHFPGAIDDATLLRLEAILGNSCGPGIRLSSHELAPIADVLGNGGRVGGIASLLMERPSFPVRAILFEKNEATNWSLGWHQDRTICVAERREVEGFGPWTVKQGQLHVQPPQSLLDQMVTLRIHLDDVPDGNGPLLVIPGSHRRGKLKEAQIDQLVKQSVPTTHLARRGDIWVYRTPIVHASAVAASKYRARRVLQLDYSAHPLPGGLRWAFNA